MTTALRKPLTREVVHAGASYRVVMSPQGIRLTPKGKRRGIDLSWDDLLGPREADMANSDSDSSTANEKLSKPPTQKLGMADVVAADVLCLLQRANETLSDAAALIDHASELPSVLATHREPPPPSEKHRSDWYIEPLLTIRQVSDLLGVSVRRVRALPLKAIDLEGQIRYQPAELRRFLAAKAQPSTGRDRRY